MKLTTIIFMILLCSMATMAMMIETGDRIYFECINNKSGAFEGTTANMTCYDQDGNIDVANLAATNVKAGLFYYAFAETDDRYFCEINCITATSIDYVIPVLQGTVSDIDDILTDTGEIQANQSNFVTATGFSTLTTADNIGINWADVANQGTTVDLSDTAINLADTCTDVTNQDSSMAEINVSLAGGITLLTTTTETQIDNTEADTNELQTNQGNWVTATGFSTMTEINTSLAGGITTLTAATETQIDNAATTTQLYAVNTSIITQGDSAWATATGFSTHSAADVYDKLGNLTAAEVDTEITSNHGTGLYNTSDATISSADKDDIVNRTDTKLNASHGVGSWVGISGAASGNLTWSQLNISLEGDITTLTTTTETQIDNTEADTNEIQGNQSNFLTADTSTLATTTQLYAVNSSIITRGDAAWVSAVVSSLATTAQLINVNSSILARGNAAWITAVGFSTHSAADVYNKLGNLTAVEVWAAASRTLSDYSGVWSVGSRTLTAFGFRVDINSTTQAQLDTIEADTNELQTNQSNFVTADVSSLATTTDLSNVNSSILTEGGSSWITATGFSEMTEINTSLAGGITLLTSTTETQIDNTEADTDEIQGNQSNFLTATGFSTHSAADVYDKLANLTATDVFRRMVQDVNISYGYSGALPYIDTWTYDDGIIVNVTWTDNATAITKEVRDLTN